MDVYREKCEKEVLERRRSRIKTDKHCMDCAHYLPNKKSMTGNWRCDLKSPYVAIEMLDPACEHWMDVDKRVLPIKCDHCGIAGTMTGKNNLPDGWVNILSNQKYYCPECKKGTNKLIHIFA